MIRIDSTADLAENFGLLRKLTRRTQTEIGAEFGVPASRIGEFERHRRVPSPGTVIRHLRALGYQLAIVPLDQAGPETAPESTLSDQEAATHTRLGSDDLDGSTGLEGA